jgi:hypothetical protein
MSRLLRLLLSTSLSAVLLASAACEDDPTDVDEDKGGSGTGGAAGKAGGGGTAGGTSGTGVTGGTSGTGSSGTGSSGTGSSGTGSSGSGGSKDEDAGL